MPRQDQCMPECWRVEAKPALEDLKRADNYREGDRTGLIDIHDVDEVMVECLGLSGWALHIDESATVAPHIWHPGIDGSDRLTGALYMTEYGSVMSNYIVQNNKGYCPAWSMAYEDITE